MTLINYIDLVTALHWRKLGAFDDFPDVIDPSIAGGVNFNDIKGGTRRYACADFTDSTG
jgi:hypothetical protein